MKHLTIIIGLSLAIIGCGDTGQKAMKGAAEAILAEDKKVDESQQAINNQQQVQPNNNYIDPSNTQQQNGYIPNNQQQMDNAQAYVNNNGELPPKPVQPQRPVTTESVVRYRAQVLTQYGGKVVVRSAPSTNGRKLGFLYDQEEVWVIGETNNCEVITSIEGCWVKVMDSQRLVGYSFGGFLQY